VPNVNTSGPIIGQGGIVVVCGVGTDVRAFKTENASLLRQLRCEHYRSILNVNDFTCFLNRFAAGESFANCDASTVAPVLNVNDFTCFLNRYAVGCT
jgi:hypothetical protein